MNIHPQVLLNAYCEGVFPMADPRTQQVYWYDPDPRTIIPLDAYHFSRSLKRTLRKGVFEVRVDYDFRTVMQRCAEPAPGREETWINDELIALYTTLHEHGFAHSVETWLNNELVGGVYGVSIRGLFAGESMFSRVTDASKVALAQLILLLNQGGYTLFDVQYTTNHLKTFGATEISRREYKRRLEHALSVNAQLPLTPVTL